MATSSKNPINSSSEYKKAKDELLSFIRESGIEGQVLIQKLALIKNIEEYETDQCIDPVKRIEYIFQKLDVKHKVPRRTAIISEL